MRVARKTTRRESPAKRLRIPWGPSQSPAPLNKDITLASVSRNKVQYVAVEDWVFRSLPEGSSPDRRALYATA